MMARAKSATAPSDLPGTVVALADLKPYPRNPRHITPAAVNAVAESLVAFGWQQPIVIDPKRVIVAGHTRRQAALQLGWTHAPTVTIAANLARAYRLADNRSGEFSTWDLDVLPVELAALPSGQLEALPALDFRLAPGPKRHAEQRRIHRRHREPFRVRHRPRVVRVVPARSSSQRASRRARHAIHGAASS